MIHSSRSILLIATFLGALAVILGAFGAHALKQLFSVEVLEIYKTGVTYHYYHTFALLGLGVYANQTGFTTRLSWVATLFVLGIILFSGSIYGLSVLKHYNLSSWYWIGAITPLGGLSFIGAWGLWFYEIYNSPKST